MPDKNPPASGFQYSLTNLKPVEPVQKVALTFPDGAKREFPKNTTGLDIAKSISPLSANTCLACSRDQISLVKGLSRAMISRIFFSIAAKSSGVNGSLRKKS